ncbi:hypothetical protein [Flavobacterium sp. AG291]|uniref:hypothetical protein n=1 Tax=Flavobacterium sp. AG291 TaxID=2184000 RepID=UPI000E0AECBC|nr:hypothetical protein [Flavobacterium sp. AG291]RDI06983.1 hypothetical protein DEU42_11382 [Flavobacterium sp. AG291]
MKRKNFFLNPDTRMAVALLAFFCLFLSCNSNDDNNNQVTEEPELVGQPGNPRFNLKFTNEENVDLDLHVITPDGTEISYLNPFGQGGELDVDCLCEDCPQGPNENIFWEAGTAPTGTYKYWIEYYDTCGNGGSTSSDYTLRVVRNGEVLETKTGTLSSGMTQQWTHNQQ